LGYIYPKMLKKPRLVSDGCVAIRFEMLTYERVCSAFKSNRRLALEHNPRFLNQFKWLKTNQEIDNARNHTHQYHRQRQAGPYRQLNQRPGSI
jgi:hypothetical protein